MGESEREIVLEKNPLKLSILLKTRTRTSSTEFPSSVSHHRFTQSLQTNLFSDVFFILHSVFGTGPVSD